MELKDVKCANCGKDIYILSDVLGDHNKEKEKIFCTLGCMKKCSSKKNQGKMT